VVGHVNNVKYMEWCIDAVGSDALTGREVRDFEINFLNEALLGDEILIRGTGQNPVIFSALREKDDAEIFRTRLTWG
jgi:acyl-ACP thioesterase